MEPDPLPAGPTLKIQLRERPKTALMGKYSTATAQSLLVQWNYTSTDKTYLCGIIYTSGLQTPQLTSPHIHLRATGGGPGWLSGAPRLLDQKKGPPNPAHLVSSPRTPLVPAAFLGSG